MRKRILSKRERIIFDLLETHGEMRGLDLVRQSNGLLWRGIIYVYLMYYANKGFIARRSVYSRLLFRLTDKGRRILELDHELRKLANDE